MQFSDSSSKVLCCHLWDAELSQALTERKPLGVPWLAPPRQGPSGPPQTGNDGTGAHLDLGGVEVHGDDVISPSNGEHVCHQLGRDRGPALKKNMAMLLVKQAFPLASFHVRNFPGGGRGQGFKAPRHEGRGPERPPSVASYMHLEASTPTLAWPMACLSCKPSALLSRSA